MKELRTAVDAFAAAAGTSSAAGGGTGGMVSAASGRVRTGERDRSALDLAIPRGFCS